jgi:hypothetical protein
MLMPGIRIDFLFGRDVDLQHLVVPMYVNKTSESNCPYYRVVNESLYKAQVLFPTFTLDII